MELCRAASAVEGIEDVCLTTNGTLLPKLAAPLREAGVRRLNISLDTLDAEKFRYITRIGNLEDAMAGIEAALAAGFEKIKINSVLIGGFNDDEISSLAALTKKYPVDVRFIELMPMYDSGDFGPEAFIPYTVVTDRLPELCPVPADGGVCQALPASRRAGKCRPHQPGERTLLRRMQPRPAHCRRENQALPPFFG